MPTKNTLPSRLRRIARSMGWPREAERAQLKAITGASTQTVGRWFADGHIRMDARFGFRIADACGFSARWVILGEGDPRPTTLDLGDLPADYRSECVRHVHVMRGIFGGGKRK